MFHEIAPRNANRNPAFSMQRPNIYGGAYCEQESVQESGQNHSLRPMDRE